MRVAAVQGTEVQGTEEQGHTVKYCLVSNALKEGRAVRKPLFPLDLRSHLPKKPNAKIMTL